MVFIDDVWIDLGTWKISFKFRIINFLKLWQTRISTLLKNKYFAYFFILFFPFLLFFGARECISYLVRLTMLYIVGVVDVFHINIVLKKLKLEANLKACLGVFWSQNWILLAVSNINCFKKFVHICVFLLLFINRFFCLLKNCHMDIKCSKLLLYLS